MAHQNAPFLLKLLALSSTAASRAGKIIKDVMNRGDLGIIEKSVNDLQTEADRSAQRCIIASLSHHFPDLKIIGEEGTTNCTELPSDWLIDEYDSSILSHAPQYPSDYRDVNIEDVVVWVDPLDGTSDYTQGLLDHVTVLIGLAVGGRAVGGVIHQPYYNFREAGPSTSGRTIWGLNGLGVGGVDLGRQQLTPPTDDLVVVTTQSHFSDTVQRTLDALQPIKIVRVGGAGHKILLLLDGVAHAYIYPSGGCKKWDTCAPEGVLVAAGGKLTNIFGERYGYEANAKFPNKCGVLATISGVDHEGILAKIPKDILQSLK